MLAWEDLESISAAKIEIENVQNQPSYWNQKLIPSATDNLSNQILNFKPTQNDQ